MLYNKKDMPIEIRELVIKATISDQVNGEEPKVSIKFQMPTKKEIQNWVSSYLKGNRRPACSQEELVKVIREFVKYYPH